MDEINKIMQRFVKKTIQIEVIGAEPGQQEEEIKEGEIPSKDYDYLLGMPLWSLTEERVAQLIQQMQNKKEEHDALEKKPIFQLWEEDLDAFLASLTEYEEQEEKDRIGMGVLKGEGGKKKRNGPAKKKGDIITAPKPKVLKPKEQPDEYVPLA